MPPVASDFWDSVETLLDERTNGIGSRRALAARLYELDERQNQENWLRSLKRYGSGSIPTEETAALIARAFDISREDLPAVERLSLHSLDFRTRVVEGRVTAAEEFLVGRLRELADKLADAETSLTGLKRSHDRLQSRTRKLAAALREHDVDAPKRRTAGDSR